MARISLFRIFTTVAEGAHVSAYSLQHFGRVQFPDPLGFWISSLIFVPLMTMGIRLVLPAVCLTAGHAFLKMGSALIWSANAPVMIGRFATACRIKIGDFLAAFAVYMKRKDED